MGSTSWLISHLSSENADPHILLNLFQNSFKLCSFYSFVVVMFIADIAIVGT